MFIDNCFVKDLEQFRITEKSEEIIQLVDFDSSKSIKNRSKTKRSNRTRVDKYMSQKE